MLRPEFDVQVVTPIRRSVSCSGEGFQQSGFVHTVAKGATYHETLNRLGAVVAELDQNRRFDIFHAFFLPTGLSATETRGDRPLIASIRGNDAVKWISEPGRLAVIKAVLGSASIVTSVASDLLRGVEPYIPRSAATYVIPNAAPRVAKRRTARLRVPATIGMLANFRKKKGLPFLLDALQSVPTTLVDHLLLIGGFGLDRNEEERVRPRLEQLAKRFRVTVTGEVNDRRRVWEYLSEIDIFVMPSLHDGFPNATLEAASLGLPIIASNVGGLADFFTQDENAILVRPGDSREIAKALVRLLREPHLATTLSGGARRLSESLSPENERSTWSDLYRSVT